MAAIQPNGLACLRIVSWSVDDQAKERDKTHLEVDSPGLPSTLGSEGMTVPNFES